MVAELQESFSKDIYHQVHDMILALMDHTFYVFLTLNKYQSNHAVRFLEVAELNSGSSQEQRSLLNSSNYIEAWKSVNIVAKILKEQMQILLVNVKNGICNGKEGVFVDALNLNKFASIISCFSGFLWDLACVVIDTDGRNSDEKAKLSRWKLEPISELNIVQEDNDADNDMACGGMQDESAVAVTCSASSDIYDDSVIGSVHRRRPRLKDADSVVSVLTAVDSLKLQYLNKPLLRSILKGDFPNAAFLLRQLLITSSAILRLNCILRMLSCHQAWCISLLALCKSCYWNQRTRVRLVACMFNVILHLQSPLIFYGFIQSTDDSDPDPGKVILMCVDVQQEFPASM
ncbi:hypothetical protein RchiOBHm_Chr6g0244971 [Rosa chinensis]|uniref:Uncharacterized protein n=1 Tax=Rosa chinensis TaxID=74649 RepID=A0A2P6PJ51_ROSCH|nr:hypothetical protein RchiOBHm_Chr6g0244971 [Rosa chinensis]